MKKINEPKSKTWYVLDKIARELDIHSMVEGYLYEDSELESYIVSALRQIQAERKRLKKENNRLQNSLEFRSQMNLL